MKVERPLARSSPHIGRFPAHVGAGNNQHAAAIVEMQTVGDERLVERLFDHRMPAGLDFEQALPG
jgi:hypothetical protein